MTFLCKVEPEGGGGIHKVSGVVWDKVLVE
jgi:hypothetical protein